MNEKQSLGIDPAIAAGSQLRPLQSGAAMVPTTMAEVMQLGAIMATGAIAIPPPFRGQKGACINIVLQSLQWEMNPFAVINKAYVVNDRLAFEAQLIMAVINTRAPIVGRLKYDYSGEGDDMQCTVTANLRDLDADGNPFTVSVTSPRIGSIEKRNSGKGSPLWKEAPRQQLGYYTARMLARLHFPEVILGVYDRDEALEAAGVPLDAPEPIRAQPSDFSQGVDSGQDGGQDGDFELVPLWTIDDVMVSYGIPGADSEARKDFQEQLRMAIERGIVKEFLSNNVRFMDRLNIIVTARERGEPEAEPEPFGSLEFKSFLDALQGKFDELSGKDGKPTKAWEVHKESKGHKEMVQRLKPGQVEPYHDFLVALEKGEVHD